MGDQPYQGCYTGYSDTFDRGDEISPQPHGQKVVPDCHLMRKIWSGSSRGDKVFSKSVDSRDRKENPDSQI